MPEYVKLLRTDAQAICDAVREKTGETGTMTAAETAEKILTISGGGTTHIYGVTWPVSDGLLTASKGTRTDEAEDFADPVPSIGGAAGSSPFDELQPWAGMVVEDDQLAGALVKIPRFWYKWTQTASALKLQIATGPVAGFAVSPAHADRGDGKGERTYVYIARYKCAGKTAMSVSGVSPVTGIPRYFLRMVAKYGAEMAGQKIVPADLGLYQQDVAMFWTVRLLMLCEYADWDGQAALGKGCGAAGEECSECHGTGVDPESESTCPNCNGSGRIAAQDAPLDTGTTDDMPYHTGTVQASLDTWGQGIQYRHIEDMWAGCFEWLDGFCVNTDADSFNDRDMYLQTNPNHFADTPYPLNKAMDASDQDWAEWIAANVDLMHNSFDGDDPSEYFDAATMQAIGAYCAQSGDYMPEGGSLGGKVAVCVAILDTKIFRKRIERYTLNGSTLYAKTGWFSMAGQKLRGVLDLNGGSMWAEDENGNQAMSRQEMFVALIGSATIGGVKIGKTTNGMIYGWSFPENAGLGWFGIPITDGEGSAKVADRCRLGNPSLACGADWHRDSAYGPFCLGSDGAGGAGDWVGARLQKLP